MCWVKLFATGTNRPDMTKRKVVTHKSRDHTYKSMYDGEVYQSTVTEQSLEVHLLRGVCDGCIDEDQDQPCVFQAQHRIMRGQGVEDYCGYHGPEKPHERFSGPREDGHTIIDFDTECGKTVKKDESELDEEEAEDVQHGHWPCGDQGFIMIVREDEDPRVYCRTHSREAWTDILRRNEK